MEMGEFWANINGVQMRYLHAGSGSPLLLVPGLLGGSFCWRLNAASLAEQYAVHVVDLPGLDSSDETGFNCSLCCQTQRLARFIEQKSWSSLIVMGCSFGGAIAMLLAASVPQVQGMVLAAPVNPWSDFGRRRIRLLSARMGGYFLRTVLPLSGPFHGIAVGRMYGNPKRIPPDALRGYRASVLRRRRARNVLTALRSWETDVELLRKVVPEIQVRTLLVWGDRDQAVDPRSAIILRQHLSRSELKLIPGAGHLPFEESPEEFNRAVLEFLNKTR